MWGAVLASYVAIVLYGTLGPEPGEELDAVGQEVRRAVPTSTPGPRAADNAIVMGLDAEELGNIALLMPIPVLIALRWPRWWWVGLPVGVALTCAIELVQLVVLDHRSPEWRDIGWNTLGVVLGFAVTVAAAASSRRSSSRRSG